MRHHIVREVNGVKAVLTLTQKRRHRRVMYRLAKVRVFFSRRFSTDNFGGNELKSYLKSLSRFIGHSRHNLGCWENLISSEIRFMKQNKIRFCVPKVLFKENVTCSLLGPKLLSFGLSLPFKLPTFKAQLKGKQYYSIGSYLENNLFLQIVRKRRRLARTKKWLVGTLVDKQAWLLKVCEHLWLEKKTLSEKPMFLYSKPFGRTLFFAEGKKPFIWGNQPSGRRSIFVQRVDNVKRLVKWVL